VTLIKIVDKVECCGCGSCANACPSRCVKMKEDEEGFLYPIVDDFDKCIRCNICSKVCPVKNLKKEEPFVQKGYLVQHCDEQIRKESTAGGAFTAIAQYVIECGGIVFGAAYDDQLQVVHMAAEDIESLKKFRNSKYVQSNTKYTYREAEQYLKEGRLVCYSGTPCQIEGLKAYLRREYDNLITVDVVCHAVPSPLIWNKYLEMQKEKLGKKIANIRFRDKYYGYKYSAMVITGENNQELYARGVDSDQMLRAFFSNICDRPSCYNCSFKKRYRVSDFTIWDCFTVYNFSKELDDDKGTTRVLIHSSKGQEVFEKIKSRLRYLEVSPGKLTDGVKEMFQSVDMNPKRQQFFSDAKTKSGKELFEEYFPCSMKVVAERFIRVFCAKTGIYSAMKRVYKAIVKK